MSTVREIFETMEYGPAPEQEDIAISWLEEHPHAMHPFINGEFARFMDETYFESTNPRDGKPLARLVQCGKTEVNAAVAAAKAAFPFWSGLTGHERARYLYAIARQIQKHSRLFAVLESLDNGKPIRESRDIDIPLVARHFYHHAGWAQLRNETFIGYEPIGVCGQIIPWNFPLLMLAWKVAPALAAGNTVVLKPAEYTSLTALLFAELLQQISLPAGVVNIVTGDGTTGELIVRHKDVHKIAFTGSTEVGRSIRKETAGSGKKLSLELGGKSPNIVFDDCVLDDAVSGAVSGIFAATGQTCIAGSRLLLQESIHDQFVEKLVAMAKTARLGDPSKSDTQVGPVTTPAQYQKILSYIEIAKGEGAKCVLGGGPATREDGGGKYFVKPTIFTDVSNKMRIAQEEVFGPVLSVIKFKDQDEAIQIANDIAYGLGAGVWTQSLKRAHTMAGRIKAGTVWVNTYRAVSFMMPFGGYKASGLGRENGAEAIEGYLHSKSVWINNGSGGGNPFIMKTAS